RSLPKARSALALETDVLPVEDSFRDGDIEGSIAKRDMAGLVGFGHAQGNGPRGALQAITQVDQDLGVMILSAQVKLSAATPWLAAPHGSKQCVEEIALLLAATCQFRSGELDARVPIGRRLEFLPLLPLVAQLIIGGALLCVAEHFVGFADLLELAFRSWILVDVGMELASELAIGAFDLLLRGVALKAEN